MGKFAYLSRLSVIAAGSLSLAVAASAQPGPGGPMMGHGMMGPGVMGPGMMGSGAGANGCPRCGVMWGQNRANLDLSAADVRANLDQWLQWNGNARLKVGPIAETDANTVTADIVTVDRDVLVERYSIDRHSGFYRPVP